MNEKLKNLKDKKVIFLVISIIIAFMLGMFFASSLKWKKENIKENPLNSTEYNSKVLELLNSIAGIKAEDLEIINISPEKKGYIISNTKKYKALSDISNGIMNVLEKKFEFVYKNILNNNV